MGQLVLSLVIFSLISFTVWASPEGYTLRFSDMPDMDGSADDGEEPPMVSAHDWLHENGWEQVWPFVLIGKGKPLDFVGPSHDRFLRIASNKTLFIWGSEVNLDPHEFPILELSWGIDAFPNGAAMDLYKRNDRAIVVQVLFGEKLPTKGFPDLPRMLSFFWGETETVGNTYTCIPPREGPDDELLMCIYPHIKYIALRSGDEGSVVIDRVNLLDHFREQFPDYWQEHQRVPTIVGLSFEVQSGFTKSYSVARLYSIRLLPEVNEVITPDSQGEER